MATRSLVFWTLVTTAVLAGPAARATDTAADPRVAACLQDGPVGTPAEELKLMRTLQSRGPAAMASAQRIYYGDKLDQYGDLRLPQGPGPFPVAVVVHGGAWGAVANADYVAPLAELLTRAGIATWNIEYSRLGSGGEWPASFRSVGAAADHLVKLAERHPLDLKRVIAVGHSSGGHYALWLAARRNIVATADTYMRDPLKLRGVISLDGTPDLASFRKSDRRGEQLMPLLLGSSDDATFKHRLQESSPIEMLPTGTRQVFITQRSHRLDAIVDYVQRAQRAGDSAVYDILCPANHFTTVDTQDERVASKIIQYAKELMQ